MIALLLAKRAFDLLVAFLRHPLGQVVVVALVFGGLAYWHGELRYADGVKAEQARWGDRLAASEAKARQAEAKYAGAAQRAGNQVSVAQAETRTRTVYLTKEIPTYVTFDPARASLPVGLVRVLDAAAADLPVAPDPSGRADDASSGVDDLALAQSVVGNYGACHLAIAQVKGWQTWARDVGLVAPTR